MRTESLLTFEPEAWIAFSMAGISAFTWKVIKVINCVQKALEREEYQHSPKKAIYWAEYWKHLHSLPTTFGFYFVILKDCLLINERCVSMVLYQIYLIKLHVYIYIQCIYNVYIMYIMYIVYYTFIYLEIFYLATCPDHTKSLCLIKETWFHF